jgi:hypothetical protein
LDWSCEQWRSVTNFQGGEEYPNTIKRSKANWIGLILPRNCPQNHGIGGKIVGRIEVTWIRGKRRKQLLNDLKEKKGY